ncbi:hypothetical protein ACIOML_22290 [Streptomyces anulatus]
MRTIRPARADCRGSGDHSSAVRSRGDRLHVRFVEHRLAEGTGHGGDRRDGIGGLLITGTGWRGILLVNPPVGIDGWIAAIRLLPDWRPAKEHRLDLQGIALSSVGLTASVFGEQTGEAYAWGAVAGPVTIPAHSQAPASVC